MLPPGCSPWCRRSTQALGLGTVKTWALAKVSGALSRTDCAECLVSNGILVVSQEPCSRWLGPLGDCASEENQPKQGLVTEAEGQG